ncbi:hypothetical protein ACW7EJ_05065, partial [Acinetobacter soli]
QCGSFKHDDPFDIPVFFKQFRQVDRSARHDPIPGVDVVLFKRHRSSRRQQRLFQGESNVQTLAERDYKNAGALGRTFENSKGGFES